VAEVSTELVIGLLGGGGIASIAAAIVAGLFSKKKLSADAAEIITKAASGVVERLEAEVKRVERAREDAALQHRLDMAAVMEAHDSEMAEVRRVLQLHVAWDAIAIAKMGEVGIALPPAPPLLPAQRPDRPRLDMPDRV
jgi:hypothetical protein